MAKVLFLRFILLQKRLYFLASPNSFKFQIKARLVFIFLTSCYLCNAQVDQQAATPFPLSSKKLEPQKVFALNGSIETSTYNWFDKILSVENLPLHNGIVYIEKHRTKSKNSKFFPSSDFSRGSVLYDGQEYFNLNLKFNVYDDILLLRTENRLGGNILQIYKSKTQGFILANRRFIHIDSEFAKDKINSGFYELVFEKPLFSLLSKHRKLLKRTLQSSSVFYEFEDLGKEYILLYKNTFHSLRNFSDLSFLFPDHKESLNNYYASLDEQRRFNEKIEPILIYLEEIITQKN